MTDTKHTPTPWATTNLHGKTSIMAYKGQRHVCSTGGYSDSKYENTHKENEATAEFIVKACNAYEADQADQAKIKALTEALRRIVENYASLVNSGDAGNYQDIELDVDVVLARRALKEAGVE